MAGGRRASSKRLRELILYICEKSKDDPNFDFSKLCWILFKADFEAYKTLGKSITGQTYIKVPDVEELA